MEVKLISWTKDPIGTVAKAASMCYKSEPSRNTVMGCVRSGHHSVLEHANYTFEITGVSRALLAQLTRHRHASYSVESQRYVKYDDLDFVAPDCDSIGWVQTVGGYTLDAYKEMIDDADAASHKDVGCTAVTDERQGLSSHGNDAHGHSHIDEGL